MKRISTSVFDTKAVQLPDVFVVNRNPQIKTFRVYKYNDVEDLFLEINNGEDAITLTPLCGADEIPYYDLSSFSEEDQNPLLHIGLAMPFKQVVAILCWPN